MFKNRKSMRLLFIFSLVIGILILGRSLWLQWRARQTGMVHGLLTEVPCAPPCWQGFTPGTKLERNDVLRKLRQTPGIGVVWDRELQTATGGVDIVWLWNHNLLLNWFSPSWPGYNSIYLSETGLLQSITLTVDFELTVAELIDKYGIPDAINVVIAGTPENAYGSMNLFYPSHGLICRVKVLPDYRPILESDSMVYEVVYQSKNFELDPRFRQPWPGYGELEILKP